ncbi:MAG TPA: response regulator [Nitrososphaeraceae archaeon]|jgi:CheY-like chemotaxis protein
MTQIIVEHKSFSKYQQISLFRYFYSNSEDDCLTQDYLSEPSSYSLTDPNSPQHQGSNLYIIAETEIEEQPRPPFIKRILVVDDDPDLTLTFKAALDGRYYDDGDKKKRFEAYTYNEPLSVLEEFKPNFYDLLLTDIYMPKMNGFQLCEKILELDVNIRICFMSALEVNIQALRELYPNVNLGCYIEKPVTIKYLIERLSTELD